MNMKQFKYVMVLAEKGSFSRAADELNVSQPSLSQYVRRIEQDLGVILFDRAGGDVRLTDAGRVYINAGKTILDTERQMHNQFSDLSSYKTGTLTVGIAPTRCQYLMPEIVKRFSEKYPGMHLVIEERFLGNLIEDAEHGAFDMCVATLPVDENKFEYELMMQEEVILAVPKVSAVNVSLQNKQKQDEAHTFPVVDIRSIDGADYVSLTETQPTQILMNGFCKEYELTVRTAVRCMSIETQFSMVKAGIGLALIPSSIAKYVDTDSVAFYSITQETPDRKMAVIYRKGQYLSEAALTLKEIMTSV